MKGMCVVCEICKFMSNLPLENVRRVDHIHKWDPVGVEGTLWDHFGVRDTQLEEWPYFLGMYEVGDLLFLKKTPGMRTNLRGAGPTSTISMRGIYHLNEWKINMKEVAGHEG